MHVLHRNAGKRKGCKMLEIYVLSLFCGEEEMATCSPKGLNSFFDSVESLLASQELHFISFLYLVGPCDRFSPQECE